MKHTNTPTRAPKESLRRSLGRTLRWSALALSMAAAAHLDAAPPELKTQGNQVVVKATGTPVRLTGLNIPSLEWGANDNIMTSLSVGVGTWKGNVFRLPVKNSNWFGSSSASYRATVDAFIQKASDMNVYVILDLHEYNKAKTAHATFWTDAANRYKNNPAVLFGLLNEPHGIGWEVWRNGDSTGPGMQGLLNAVRATGANNVVLAGGTDWGFNLSGILTGYALTDTSSGNGIIYDSHVYPWKGYIQRDVLTTALVHPVLLGEFGHPSGTTSDIVPSSFEHHSTWVPRMMDWVNTNNLHWTGWSFHTSATPRMLLDWSYEPTEYWGEHARAHLQSYADSNAKRVVGGTVIGTTGTRTNPSSGVISAWDTGAVAAFSNSYDHYFDASTPSDGWTGLDLRTARRITQIKYMPRNTTEGRNRMVGGVFQGSNSATFSSGVVTLHTITATPPGGKVYVTANVTNTGTYRYVRYKGPANSYCNVASILFYTGDDSGPGSNDDVIVIDNGGTGSTITGSWGNASGSGYHGTRWVNDGNSGKGTKSIKYTPTIIQGGDYKVYVIWAQHESRATNVPYKITHANGSTTIPVDQTDPCPDWHELGTFTFNAGTSGNLEISNNGTTNYVSADAVMFVRATGGPVEIILDKAVSDTPGIVTTGSWTSSNSVPNFYGDRYFHDNNSSKGSKSVRFTPTITSPGQYAVYVRRHDPHSSRATNARVDVTHAGGTALHTVNQRTFSGGGGWYLLGNYTFNTGTSGNVLVRNASTDDGHVVADAVRFLKIN